MEVMKKATKATNIDPHDSIPRLTNLATVTVSGKVAEGSSAELLIHQCFPELDEGAPSMTRSV